MNETINDRIEALVNQLFNGNKAAFAKAIGLAPTAMSSYLGKQRRSKPSVDMVTKIIVTLNVDARWLLTGEDTSSATVHTEGDYSPAVGNSENVSVVVGDAVLTERVKMLEALLEEKERLIKVLMQR